MNAVAGLGEGVQEFFIFLLLQSLRNNNLVISQMQLRPIKDKRFTKEIYWFTTNVEALPARALPSITVHF